MRATTTGRRDEGGGLTRWCLSVIPFSGLGDDNFDFWDLFLWARAHLPSPPFPSSRLYPALQQPSARGLWIS